MYGNILKDFIVSLSLDVKEYVPMPLTRKQDGGQDISAAPFLTWYKWGAPFF